MTNKILCTNIVITMQLQTIFKAGNSQVVAIPSDVLANLNLKTGNKVLVGQADDTTIVIKKTSPKIKKSDAGFQKWLNVFMKENAEVLDELADR